MSNLPVPVETGLKSLIPGVVRTLVPLVVSVLVGWGFSETETSGPVIAVLTVLVTALYYVVVRLLERHWDKIGWLLGYPQQPVYVPGEVIKSVDEPVVVDASPRSDLGEAVVEAPVEPPGEHRADVPPDSTG